MVQAKKIMTQGSQKHAAGIRTFVEEHEDAIWAVVLGLGLLLMSFYSA